MAGLVEVELDDVFAGLDRMVRAGEDLRPVWRDVRAGLVKDLKDHFAERSGPEGGWAAPATSTIDKILHAGGSRRNVSRRGQLKRRAARRLADQLGRLKSAWRLSYDRGSLEARSRVPWAGIHQGGGVAGHGARIPARPFAWASFAFLGAVTDRILVHLRKAWS